ncbi:F0F1 ATP synthase subunit delta [Coxiella endosymbiont of Amblyomma americanum]|uniref:F0F1 ATP synthase subunit delta n=1 Tax=Coxiella endosymbiont of Amblyomma americanum TaxID=325775 RepID=UPI0005822A64|nr:F0F1 ATP synthase subunit delta [Coxiella endosymbiont of Amblyomma americanum]AJC50162.1 ATP synthase F1 subcomplex delta subunit [Coxiella endosymbiont of Amblyomma americanum]AUJ58521.1 F0F1 ATP synthase subunit delta [Coxiella-like endosymbiont of Amblyomma americanum]
MTFNVVQYFTLSRPYAQALFIEAKESRQLNFWLKTLHVLSILIEHRSIIAIVRNPSIPNEKVKNILLKLLSEIKLEADSLLEEKLGNFLRLLINKRKLILLPSITLLYKNLLNSSRKILEATVVSAILLNNNQKNNIKKKLEKRFNTRIKLKTAIDESLVGGGVIYVGDWVMDGSIKGKIARLSENLKEA